MWDNLSHSIETELCNLVLCLAFNHTSAMKHTTEHTKPKMTMSEETQFPRQAEREECKNVRSRQRKGNRNLCRTLPKEQQEWHQNTTHRRAFRNIATLCGTGARESWSSLSSSADKMRNDLLHSQLFTQIVQNSMNHVGGEADAQLDCL
jgi:hypothetical protein